MAMLRGPSTAALGIPADPSVEGVGVVAVAQPGGDGTTSTTGSRLPITTSSTNSHKTCEGLLEIDERQFGRPNIIVVYIRNVGLTSPWVQSALELLRVRLPEASTVV